MLKLNQFAKKIKEKAQLSLINLEKRLIDRNAKEFIINKGVLSSDKGYLNESLPAINRKKSINFGVAKPKSQNQNNKSSDRLNVLKVMRPIRNSSSNASQDLQRQLQKKKEMLMIEIKEIDMEMKNKHLQDHIKKMKRNKTQVQLQMQSYQKASKLIEKMNIQRKRVMQKKTKQALMLKNTVQQSIRKFKEMQLAKKEQQLKKKIEIEKRIESRKYHALERERLNKMTNQIIKQLNSYKVSLPDIYSHHYRTLNSNNEDYKEVLLTNVQDDADLTSPKADNRQSRVSTFLQSIQKEQIERRKLSQKKKQYQKNVRQKQIEFGKRIRNSQKLKTERKDSQSKSKIKKIKQRLQIHQNRIYKIQQPEQTEQVQTQKVVQ